MTHLALALLFLLVLTGCAYAVLSLLGVTASLAGLIVIAARVLFGAGALLAGFALLLSPFVFDNPVATANPLAKNLVGSFAGYILIYVISIVRSTKSLNRTISDRARMLWAFSPLIGLLWVALALGLLEWICNGSFGCNR
jgi:hypothetical protein